MSFRLYLNLSLLLNSSYSELKRFSISWALPSLFYLGSLIGRDGARKNSGCGQGWDSNFHVGANSNGVTLQQHYYSSQIGGVVVPPGPPLAPSLLIGSRHFLIHTGVRKSLSSFSQREEEAGAKCPYPPNSAHLCCSFSRF